MVLVVEEDIDSDTQVLEQTRCKFATSRISLEAKEEKEVLEVKEKEKVEEEEKKKKKKKRTTKKTWTTMTRKKRLWEKKHSWWKGLQTHWSTEQSP
ncbi:hypothetical protein M0802_003306 [Mischocyttarus mexicanus]|nr:hypothetical protein M0802_003306 [Mischocyttarus mexicanus]